MDDAAYCATDCPQGKRCPVADPDIGCFVGTELPNNPGRPRCCEVDGDDRFLDTVRAILRHGNKHSVVQQNAGTAGFRQAFQDFLDSMNVGGPPEDVFIDNGLLEIESGYLEPSTVDDLVKLMHEMVPDSGFKVKMEFDDIERQPVALRENPRNYFMSEKIYLDYDVPSNALTVAAHLQVYALSISGFRAVSLVIHALANPDPWPTADTDTELRLQLGCDPKISRRHVTQLKNAMRSTRFVGRVAINSHPNPFEDDVQLGQSQVAQGRDINVSAHGLEIIIA